MGEKAATNEVISKLVSALGDESGGMTYNVCSALGKMGKKAATNEVISKLANIIKKESRRSYRAAEAVENILSSSSVIVQLDPSIIAGFCLSERASDCFKNVSEDEIIKFSFNTENPAWLSAVAKIAVLKGVGVTLTGDKVVIYSSKEPVEVCIPNGEFSRQLVETFSEERRGLHLYFNTA
jgi:hypothetical protein